MAISGGFLCRNWVINIVILHLLSSAQSVASSSRNKIATRRLENDGSIDNYYMTNHCRHIIGRFLLDHNFVPIENQAFLMAHPMEDIESSPMYVSRDRCVTTFAAPPTYELLIHFQDLAIDCRPQYLSRLDIYNGFDIQRRLSPYNGLYGESQGSEPPYTNLIMKDYVSNRQQALTLEFKGHFSKRFYGFKALLTAVKRPLKNGTCPRNLFRCVKNWYCIQPKLVCNGISNCGEGDASDEGAHCNAKAYQLTSPSLDDLGLMIGCGVSILILLMAVIWVGVVCHKRLNRASRQRHQLTDPDTNWCPVEEGVPEDRERSRWIPRTLYDSVSPWLCREAPPAYNESAPSNEAAGQFKPPPPYNEDANENGSLIPTAPPQPMMAMAGNMDLRANVIANPIAPCIERGEMPPSYEPPSYEESNNIQANLRCPIMSARPAQQAALGNSPEAVPPPNTQAAYNQKPVDDRIGGDNQPKGQSDLNISQDAKLSAAPDA